MARQATYQNYVVTIEDNGGVSVTKDGEKCSKTTVALREIAQQMNFTIDPKWNTQQIGAKIYKEISSGKSSEDEKITAASKAPVAKPAKVEAKPEAKASSKELDAAQAEIERLKAELVKVGAKEEKPAKTSKSNDPFEGLMVDVCAGMFTQRYTYWYETNYGDKRRKMVSVPVENSRRVTISKGYKICKYPVTQGQWKAVMGEGFNPSHFRGDDDLPVEMVSWNDCQEFIKKLNEMTGKKYRLPTEAEWQWAAMGASKDNDQGIYAGCNSEADLEKYAWYGNNSERKTHPVGKKKPNELGLYDMCGNVLELCQDWYQDSLGTSDVTDPQGPQSGSRRVCRGGCWESSPLSCRLSYRCYSSADDRYSYVGFRLVMDGEK